MINQNSQFFAILTNVGLAKQANADALGVPWKITQMGIGDANDTDPLPAATQTKLINEWRRAPLNSLNIDPTNSAIVIAEQVIPADVGGKWIREIALYDSDGDMVAVANCAPSFKPLLAQGSGRTQVVRLNMQVTNSSNVELKIDPSVVLATRAYVDQKVIEELNKQDFKLSVVAATTGPIVLNGLQTVDGEPGAEGKRTLVWKQTLAKENGLYLMSANAWTRAPDADTSLEVTPGLFVHVEKGDKYGDSVFQLVTDAPIVLGTTDLVFESPIGKTGVAAGTFTKVTVDKYGRVVGGTNPTTLAAYGIIDVYDKTQVDALIASKVDSISAMFPFRGRAAFIAAGVSNWAVPAGVKKVWVRVVGGGGGAGRYEGGGGAGGGGGVAEKLIDLTGVASVTLTVGDGGLGRTGSSGDGANGGTSSFGSYCSATGGGGGSKWYGGLGGFGSGGDINTNLGNGAHQTRQDNSATSTSIYGGGHGGGPGGAGSGSGAKGSPGNNATLPGGGGGGGNENGNGGNGAPGSIEIRW